MHGVAQCWQTIPTAVFHTLSHHLIGDFGWDQEMLGIAQTYLAIDVVDCPKG